jgi:hypothetical protein
MCLPACALKFLHLTLHVATVKGQEFFCVLLGEVAFVPKALSFYFAHLHKTESLLSASAGDEILQGNG